MNTDKSRMIAKGENVGDRSYILAFYLRSSVAISHLPGQRVGGLTTWWLRVGEE